jgi:hypothetical protein
MKVWQVDTQILRDTIIQDDKFKVHLRRIYTPDYFDKYGDLCLDNWEAIEEYFENKRFFYADLIEDVKLLSSYCDGAVSQDGQGFNKFDAPFGHRIAKYGLKIDSEEEIMKLKAMLYKYRKQLGKE